MKAIGIDWGHRELCVAVVDDVRRQPLCTYLCAHDPAALLALLERESGHEPLRIVIEAGKRLLADSLRARGYAVVEVAPDRADAARKAYFPGGAKDDRRDARALALAALEAPCLLGALVPLSPRRRQLRQLTLARTRIVQCRVRALQQLIDVVRSSHPGLAALELDYTTHYALALAKAYAHPLRARRARRTRIERIIRRAHSLDPQRVLDCLHDDTHVIDEHVAAAAQLEIQLTVERIELLTRHITRYDQRIAAAFEQHPDADILTSVPGIGPSLAPRIAARIDRDTVRSMSHVKAQTLAGTSPRTQSSGGRRGGTVLRRTACDHDLHQALVAMARGSLRTCPWARSFVRHHTAGRLRDPRRFHMAIRALANKWLKIIHTLLLRRVTYDGTLHLNRLRAAGVPWAPEIQQAA